MGKIRCGGSNRSRGVQEKRFSKIKEHLLELGYTEQDVRGIKYNQSADRDNELTSRGWNMIRSGLEAKIQQNCVQQAKVECRATLYKRANIVKGLLKTYKQNFLPIIWQDMPPYIDVCMFPMFKAILNHPTEDNVMEDSFADAMNELPDLIADWQQRREADLWTAVTTHFQPADGIDPLKLAIAVFSCKSKECPGHFTNTDIWQHQCPSHGSSNNTWYSSVSEIQNASDLYKNLGYWELSFDTMRSAKVADVVCLASRDPATTTAEEMDVLDFRFVTLDCRVQEYASVGGNVTLHGRPVLSWQLLFKAWGLGEVHLLMPEDKAKKQHVLRRPWRQKYSVFCCQHCSDNLDNPKSYEEVTGHARDMHGIDTPKINHDLFLTPGAELLEELPLYILEFEKPRTSWPSYFNY
ncbi:uncharacterized protein EV420DRAFT_1692246 [Desarmillaria tabescens]|uniref:Uncharacterized protein n=1 Tax=Armillaria tabescens TaxID=1929756 RepID=A0AA39K6U8_ARMTA|nr:uncharacterized protein EV420DRAFT_1692246 [Desarmillaria tabescens]KAK0455647.1 hypothetical protein EV420DRAFT_1692246 [Desarmillaria tabescens]